MHVKELFPTHIFTDINLELAEKLLPLCNKYTEITKTNCLHIDQFPSTLQNKDLEVAVNEEPLVKYALDYIIKQCLIPFLDYKGIDLKSYLHPYGFFSSMHKGAHLRKHCHLDCMFSGIVYLEVGENVPPLRFYDPRPFRDFMHFPVVENNYRNEAIHILEPKIGMIAIWDSWLNHEVHEKLTDDPRKTFVFNL
jgi:hypothetical protein